MSLDYWRKKEVEGTDMMSFKFSKKNEQEGADNNNNKSLDYTAGQYAYFDIGGVSNDPKGPVRHFTIASSPTEDFVMISTRIRDTLRTRREICITHRSFKACSFPVGRNRSNTI